MSRPEPSVEKIQEAIEAGLKPIIVVVHVEPELALQRTFQRFEEYGRGASIQVMADIQSKLPDGLQKIHEHFDEAVLLVINDNRIPSQHKQLHGWEHLNLLTKEGNHDRITQRLTAELDRQHDAGRITEDCYRQAKGANPVDRRLEQAGDQENQRNRDERGSAQRDRQADQVAAHRPARAVAFEQLPHDQAMKAHPELTGAVRELAARTVAIKSQSEDPVVQGQGVTQARTDIQGRLEAGKIPPLPAQVYIRNAPALPKNR